MTSENRFYIDLANNSGYLLVGTFGESRYRWRLGDMQDAVATRLEGRNEFDSPLAAKIALGKAIAEAGPLEE